MQPRDIFPRDQNAADPVGCPRVVENRFTLLVASDCVGDDCRIRSLVVSDRVAQIKGVKLVFYNLFAAPTGIAAGKISLAVTIGVKNLGEFRGLSIVRYS